MSGGAGGGGGSFVATDDNTPLLVGKFAVDSFNNIPRENDTFLS